MNGAADGATCALASRRSSPLRLTLFLIAALMAILVSACGSGGAACVAPRAELPATVAAGQTVTFEVEDVSQDCHDTGQRPTRPAGGTVTVYLAAPASPAEPLLSVESGPISERGTAAVTLTIPTDADGRLALFVGTQRAFLGELIVS